LEDQSHLEGEVLGSLTQRLFADAHGG